MERLSQILSALPFILSANPGGIKMNSVRLFELIVMAASSGGVIYGVMTTQISGMREDMKKIEISVKENRAETRDEFKYLQQEFRDVKRDLYSPDGFRENWGTRKDRTIR
jgi:1-aminocyclopropane-1-carboxylate deaminase/D-cysteine desulfhydrase-like pyridoxal-dependent ACC family enzyme